MRIPLFDLGLDNRVAAFAVMDQIFPVADLASLFFGSAAIFDPGNALA